MHNQYPLATDKPFSESQLTLLWNDVTKDLRTLLGNSTFDLWFTGFSLESVDAERILVHAPGSMYAIWVEENFKESLLNAFGKYLDGPSRIRFEVPEGVAEDEKGAASLPVPADGAVVAQSISEEKLLEKGREAGLSEIYRFDTFVPGENSELAWAAANAVANAPGKTYQPLYFNSACGLGKTHLLHAIGWESLRQRPKSKILFVTAEEFANDYIDAIQKNALSSFRKKYREADLLLIDDVQFLGRKEGLQREFFHTFNRLSDQQKQIVLASDCPASEINELEDRLVSRFQSGLSVEIHRPGLETRAAILRKKRNDWNMQVSDDLINAIVEKVRGNVRALEGALIRVAMVATMNEEKMTPDHVGEIIADICDVQECRQLGVDEIRRAVAEHFDVSLEVMASKKRTARVAEARQVAMYLVRQLTELSLVEIASSFGKDHGTVIYAVKKVKNKCEDSPSFKSTVELIKRRLSRAGSSSDSARSTSPGSNSSASSGFRQYGSRSRNSD